MYTRECAPHPPRAHRLRSLPSRRYCARDRVYHNVVYLYFILYAKVLRPGIVPDEQDSYLASVYGGTTRIGVLPMLQFCTAFTYFIHRSEAAALDAAHAARTAAAPISLHAIFSHGKSSERKV